MAMTYDLPVTRSRTASTIPGTWGIPRVTFNGDTGGLSHDGRLLVLSTTGFGQPLRSKSGFVVVDEQEVEDGIIFRDQAVGLAPLRSVCLPQTGDGVAGFAVGTSGRAHDRLAPSRRNPLCRGAPSRCACWYRRTLPVARSSGPRMIASALRFFLGPGPAHQPGCLWGCQLGSSVGLLAALASSVSLRRLAALAR